MKLQHSFRVLALAAIAAPLALVACGLGSGADVGDDGQNQTSTGGTTSTTPEGTGAKANGSGGSTTPPATGTGGDPAASGGNSSSGGSTGGGEACGKTTCTAGQYCCNASCGMCAPMGAACIQIACDPDPKGVECGNTTCAAGQECCNPSCGICVEPGGMCTQQVCEPPPPADGGTACNTLIAPVCGPGQEFSYETCGCVPLPRAGCTADSDCRLEADYCTGCNCVALAAGESLPACTGPGVQCFADPCTVTPLKAACVDGQCVAQK